MTLQEMHDALAARLRAVEVHLGLAPAEEPAPAADPAPADAPAPTEPVADPAPQDTTAAG